MTRWPAFSRDVRVAGLAAAPATGALLSVLFSAALWAADADPGEDIRDIRGPKTIFNPWLIVAIVAAVLIIAALAYGVWRWLRSHRKPRVLTPAELALERLAGIRALMQPANARDFSISVSDIVRNYIEQRFDVTATHRTTEEFLHDLLGSTNASLARHRALLEEFLNQCDLVKFAGISLSTETMESLHASAIAFVTQTAAPDPPAAPAPSSAPSPRPAATPTPPPSPRPAAPPRKLP